MNSSLQPYLLASEYLDWTHPAVLAQAQQLAEGATSAVEIAQACFAFVRDVIRHSWDHAENPVTCSASDVLAHRTGFCYAKSHLLAALLRANGMPAGLCYQRLTVDGDGPPFCLHGLNAVYLPQHGWYRMDARGNKPGVAAAFTPPVEQLAFALTHAGEFDVPGIWDRPLPVVVQALQHAPSYDALAAHLPDLPELSALPELPG